MHLAAALFVIALISSVLAFKGGAPPVLKSPPATANGTSKAHDVGGETAETTSDVSTIPQAGLSAAMPNAPKVDPQVIEGLASKISAQSAGLEAARSGTPIVSQAPFQERWSATDTSKPAAKPVGTSLSRTGLPAKPPGKLTARVVVEGTEWGAFAPDTPIPPLPIRTPTNAERKVSEAKSIQPVVESAVAPPPPEAAVKQPSNPLLSALADLFGGQESPVRQPVDFATVGSTDWTIQLGAPRSEAEAKRDLRQLNTRYGSALKGATISLRKVLVNGDTVYRLRADGLSRENAAALCSRVKNDGGSCSIAR
jgi:hypothetical protein